MPSKKGYGLMKAKSMNLKTAKVYSQPVSKKIVVAKPQIKKMKGY